MFGFLKDKLKSTFSKISEKFSKEEKVQEKPQKAEDSQEIRHHEEKKVEKEPQKIIPSDIPKKQIDAPKVKDKKAETPIKEPEHKKEPDKIVHIPENKKIHTQKQEIKEPEKKIQLQKKEEIKIPVQKNEEPIKEEAPKKEIPKQAPTQKIEEPIKEEKKPEEEKRGFFGFIKHKITTTTIDEKQFEELFSDLEMSLLENNVALEVIEKIKEDLKRDIVDKPIARNAVDTVVKHSLKESLEEVLDVPAVNLFERIKAKKPFVICFFGINGSGKTTTIAKMVSMLKERKISCVIAAADTFRAASIEQLQLHADKLNVKLIKHDYGSDPAAVAFDAIRHAEAKNIDVVLVDTAGRMHSNTNLLDEMRKIVRVAKPDLKIFVGESITGNDCVEQAQTFNSTISIDGIILTKADVDEKGGAALSISYITKKPIMYIGIGQEYADLREFSSSLVVESLGLE